MADIILHKPSDGEVIFLNAYAEDTFSFSFDPQEALLERKNNDLILSFKNSTQTSGIIVTDFYCCFNIRKIPKMFHKILSTPNEVIS